MMIACALAGGSGKKTNGKETVTTSSTTVNQGVMQNDKDNISFGSESKISGVIISDGKVIAGGSKAKSFGRGDTPAPTFSLKETSPTPDHDEEWEFWEE